MLLNQITVDMVLLNGGFFVCLPIATVTVLQMASSAITVTAITASITWNMKLNVSKL